VLLPDQRRQFGKVVCVFSIKAVDFPPLFSLLVCGQSVFKQNYGLLGNATVFRIRHPRYFSYNSWEKSLACNNGMFRLLVFNDAACIVKARFLWMENSPGLV